VNLTTIRIASVFCCHLRIPATAGQIHSDQTGKFIVASSAGNNYILVVYDYDSQQHPRRTIAQPDWPMHFGGLSQSSTNA
jgi:hypothetical protein